MKNYLKKHESDHLHSDWMSSITKDETAANDRAPQASKKLVDIKQDHLEKRKFKRITLDSLEGHYHW